MNHLEIFELEKAWDSDMDKRWDAWCCTVERLLGIDNLDGDEANGENAFSLDSAHDYFRDGKTPEQYVERVRAKELARDQYNKMTADKTVGD